MLRLPTYLTLGFAGLLFLVACDTEELTLRPNAEPDLEPLALAKAGPGCFNLKTSADAIDLGCAGIPEPLDCSPGAALWQNFGAIPTEPVTFGPYTGYMTSIATGLEQSGNPPTGNGALHITLFHYFVTLDGAHAFWTEDQAVCAPGSNPYSCIVNDVLDIIGGCGDFAGASGRLHTHGELTFDGGAESCPAFYLGGESIPVPTGSLAVKWHGRICRS